jgi:hypothetical protein
VTQVTRRNGVESRPPDVTLDNWHRPPCEAQGPSSADLSAGAPGTPLPPNPENPTTEANADENVVTIQIFVLLLLLVLVCLLLLLILPPGFAGSVRQDAATGVPQATGGSITSAASLGPLVVRRELKPRRLLGRSRKWQSPLWDTPWNSHTSPKCATTSTSLRPAWRKPQTRLEAHRETRQRAKNVRTCAEFAHARKP